MTSPESGIAALADATAIRVLADVADYQAALPEPAQLRASLASARPGRRTFFLGFDVTEAVLLGGWQVPAGSQVG